MINYWDFHGKNWCKILEARIGGVERRKEKEKQVMHWHYEAPGMCDSLVEYSTHL